MHQHRYGMSVTTDRSPEDAEATVREALAAEGFGILTEIDVAATLASKLGIVRAPYKILGACNPNLANQALEVEESVGLLLPCNVVVYESNGTTVVAALEPTAMMEMADNQALEGMAIEAKELLTKALAAVPA